MKKIFIILSFVFPAICFSQTEIIKNSSGKVVSFQGSILKVSLPPVEPIRIYSSLGMDVSGVYWLDEVQDDTLDFVRFPIANLENATGFASSIEDFWTPYDTNFTVVYTIRRKTSVDTRFSLTGSDISNTNFFRTTNPQNQTLVDGVVVINQIPTGINNDTTYKVIGFSYDTTDNRWRLFWDSFKYTSALTEELNPAPDAHNFAGVANNTDLELISLMIYEGRLSDADIDTIRLRKKYPSGKLDFGMFFTGQYDFINIFNQDIVSGNDFAFANNGVNTATPPNLYDTTASDPWAAYPLMVGYTESGVKFVPYQPDSTKGSFTLPDEIEHASNGTNNRYPCYVDMNPDGLTGAAYDIWDKSDVTYWKDAVRGSEHYFASDPFLWHNYDEINKSFIDANDTNNSVSPLVQFDYTAIGDSQLTHIQKMYIYDQASTERDRLVRDTILLFEVLGNSIGNGLLATVDTNSNCYGISIADRNYYFFGGTDSVYNNIYRFDGGMFDPPLPGHEYTFPNLYYKKNCYWEPSKADTSFNIGFENIFGVNYLDSVGTSNPVAFSCVNHNGTGMRLDNTVQNWNVAETSNNFAMFRRANNQFEVAARYLNSLGFVVKHMGIFMTGQTTADTWDVTSDSYTKEQWTTDMTDFADSIIPLRQNFLTQADSIKIFYTRPTVVDDPAYDTINNASIALDAADSRFHSLDMDNVNYNYCDDVHPDGQSQVNWSIDMLGFYLDNQ